MEWGISMSSACGLVVAKKDIGTVVAGWLRNMVADALAEGHKEADCWVVYENEERFLLYTHLNIFDARAWLTGKGVDASVIRPN